MRLKDIVKVTGVPILLASLCCLTPIVLVLFGVSTAAFATSLTYKLDGPYKWVFLSVGVISLAISSVMYFRKKGICTLDQVKKHRNEIINKVMVIVIATVIGYVLFFNIFLGYVGILLHLWSSISFRP